MKIWHILLLPLSLFAQIHWQPIEEAFQRARQQNKLLLIYIYTPWCAPCLMMEQNSWSHPAIVSYAAAHFHCTRLNGEARDSLLFNGTFFFYEPEVHANELAYLLLDGKMEYPALVLMEPNGNIALALRGYLSPRLLDEVLRYFGEGLYRTMSWETFQTTYPSNL